MMNTIAIGLCLIAASFVTADDYDYEGDVALMTENFFLPNTNAMSNLNGNFKVTVRARSQNDGYPRSYSPLYFQKNPIPGRNQGWSMGHGQSKERMEIRMGTTNGFVFKPFIYKTSLNVVDENIFEVSCMKISGGRICSVVVNGEATQPASQWFATGDDDIFDNKSGGMFGNVWGWRFMGVLHSVSLAQPTSQCIHYGTDAVSNTNNVKMNPNKQVDFRCQTTTATTTTSATSTTTTTTNTIAGQAKRYNDHIGLLNTSTDYIKNSVTLLQNQNSLLQTEIGINTETNKNLKERLTKSENLSANLQEQLDALKLLVASLAVTSPSNPTTPICQGQDSTEVIAPSVSTSTDGTSIVLSACDGSITLSSLECDVNPCKTQQDVADIQAALAKALGGN